MRTLILLAVLTLLPLPALASQHVTIEQLQQILAAQKAAHKSDSDTAGRVGSLELTEELTTEALGRITSQWKPGPNTRQALELLADYSTFLPPPASDLPATPTPDIATQRAFLTAAIQYVLNTEHHLPDFLATRVTQSYDNMPQVISDSEFTPYLTLHSVGSFKQPITYRNGLEVLDAPASTSPAGQKPAQGPPGLTSWGEFGPVLAIVLTDSTKGRVIWNRWQQTATGQVAVFHYQVPKNASHFIVNYCCAWKSFNDRGTPLAYRGTPGYHGNLYVDPATGVILRLTLEAEFSQPDLLSRAAISVQYGKVNIGGLSFICPIRSVALTQAPLRPKSTDLDANTRSVTPDPNAQITRINEVKFTDYHRFGTSMRILAGSPENAPPPAPNSANPPAATATAQPAPAPAATTPPPGTNEAQAAPANPPAAPPQQVPPATVAAASAPSPATPAPPAIPPTVADHAATLSRTPTFTTTTRNVVEDVVVRKRNGAPVLGLQEQDFQITEDGKPQTITFFEEHTANAAPGTAPPPQMPPMPPGARTNVPPAPEGDAVNVLLIDTLNTDPQDQSFVHSEIMDFLKKMTPGTRLAVFALGSKLRFVQGFTTDTAVLRAAINDKHHGVMPQKDAASRTAGDSADDASSVSTLRTMQMSEAGIAALTEAEANQSGYQYGERVSMTFQALNYLANYLAGVPGRKNLIWFASSFPVTVFPTVAQKRQMSQLPGYLSQSRQTADLLSVSNVAVYPVGAQGIMVDSAAGADSSSPTGTPNEGSGHIGGMASPMGSFSGAASQRAGTIAFMEQLAADTGGRAFYNTNDLNSALKSAIADGSSYYTLVYSPTNTKMDGSYRQIAVSLDKGKYKLAYRTGYNADDSAVQPASTPTTDPLGPLLRFGLPGATGILYGVSAAPAATQPAPDAPLAGQNWKLKGPTTRYNVDFVIRPKDVVLLPAEGARRTGKILIGLMAYDRDGQAVNWAGDTQAMELEPDTYRSVQKTGIPAHLVIDLPANADVQLVTGIYDWNTGLAGTLEIPIHPAATTATATRPASSKTN